MFPLGTVILRQKPSIAKEGDETAHGRRELESQPVFGIYTGEGHFPFWGGGLKFCTHSRRGLPPCSFTGQFRG